MVSITSLTGNGLKDWLIQRISAVYLLVYVIFLLGFLSMHMPLDYTQWSELFQCQVFKIATILALSMILVHAWIGIWTVTTDYVRCTVIRVTVQVLVALFLSSQFVWGLMIVWGQ